jgi:hypothetical protein
MEGDQWIEGQMEEAQPQPIHVRVQATFLFVACVCVLSSHMLFGSSQTWLDKKRDDGGSTTT